MNIYVAIIWLFLVVVLWSFGIYAKYIEKKEEKYYWLFFSGDIAMILFIVLWDNKRRIFIGVFIVLGLMNLMGGLASRAKRLRAEGGAK